MPFYADDAIGAYAEEPLVAWPRRRQTAPRAGCRRALPSMEVPPLSLPPPALSVEKSKVVEHAVHSGERVAVNAKVCAFDVLERGATGPRSEDR
eukprot:scaffold7352_cov254-Pinguiococcus_pyrenoidosus.AAC.38